MQALGGGLRYPSAWTTAASEVFEGFRVTHNIARGPSKGGIRCHPGVSLDQMKALAMQMTWKCSLMGLPSAAPRGASCATRTASPTASWSA